MFLALVGALRPTIQEHSMLRLFLFEHSGSSFALCCLGALGLIAFSFDLCGLGALGLTYRFLRALGLTYS